MANILTKTEILEILSSMATKDLSHVLSEDGANFNYTLAKQTGGISAVKKYTIDTKLGKITVELYDKLDIITLLLKTLDNNNGVSGLGGVSSITLDDLVLARKQLDDE